MEYIRHTNLFRSLLSEMPIRKWAREQFRVDKAIFLVKYFYFFNAFWMVYDMKASFIPAISGKTLTPVWALSWQSLVTPAQMVTLVSVFFWLTVLIGTLWFTSRIGRVLVFLGLLEYIALEFALGYGSIMEWYPWLYTAFFFIFLPNGFGEIRASLEDRSKVLLVIWAAQALFLQTYTLAGIHKVIIGIGQLFGGQMNTFSPQAFAQQLAYLLPKYQENISIFGSFIIEHPLIGWPLYLGMVYIQLFSFWAALRPSIQKLWAVILIVFHVGSGLTFHIVFLPEVMLLFLLFFDSPFLPTKVSLNMIFSKLPVFGLFFRFKRK